MVTIISLNVFSLCKGGLETEKGRQYWTFVKGLIHDFHQKFLNFYIVYVKVNQAL